MKKKTTLVLLLLSAFATPARPGDDVARLVEMISHFGAPGAVAADLQINRLLGRSSVPFRPRETY